MNVRTILKIRWLMNKTNTVSSVIYFDFMDIFIEKICDIISLCLRIAWLIIGFPLILIQWTIVGVCRIIIIRWQNKLSPRNLKRYVNVLRKGLKWK